MLSGDLAAYLSETLQNKASLALDRWKLLRSAGLLNKNGHGPRSGARMTERDCINGLLALLTERRIGDDVAANVRAVRALPPDTLTELPRGLTNSLKCFAAETAGLALEGLISDLRSGRIASLVPGGAVDLCVNFDLRGQSIIIDMWLPRHADEITRGRAMRTFGLSYKTNQPVARNATINGSVFAHLAAKLGPLPESS